MLTCWFGAGFGLLGISKLLMNEQVDSVINSYPGDNTDIIDRLYKGKIRFEVLPQVLDETFDFEF